MAITTNAVNTMVKAITTRFEKVDILVNNAGAALGVPADIRNYDETAWLKTIDVNLHGVFRVSKAILPMMLGVGGSIINMSSRAGKVPPLFNGAYAVAKSGVIMLTKVMALELAASRVRVNAVCPGLIQTDMQTWRINLEADFFDTTFKAREEALRAGMHYPFVGNVPGHPGNHTYCPGCGEIVVRRHGFFVMENKVHGGRCKACDHSIAGVWI